jgi:hypothetical protein
MRATSSSSIARVAGAALVGSLVVTAAPASANGRFPASNQIVFSPASPTTILGRTTFGFLPSVDNGATWQWICEDALALPPSMTSDPELAITAGGALVAGLPTPFELGVSVSNDLGCNWDCIGSLEGSAIADIVLRASSPHSVLALVSSGQAADGGLVPSQVYESTDDGATWAPLGVPFDTTDITLQVLSIDVAASDAQRIYVSAIRSGGATRRASLFVSRDDAQTWTEEPLAQFDPSSEGSIYIGAVDPMDPDRVYVRSAGILAQYISANASCMSMYGGSRLFVTTDAGGSFDVVDLPVTCQILGFALSPDGSRVYAGTYGDGLFAASSTDLKFTRTSPVHVECLATRGDELWTCSDAASGFIIGSSTNEGACFEAKLPSLTGITGAAACNPMDSGPVACMAAGNGSICTSAAFQSLCENPFAMPDGCFVGPGTDAGCVSVLSDDAGVAAPQSPAAAHGGCGCAMVGQGRLPWLAALGVIAAAASAAAVRRRRRT